MKPSCTKVHHLPTGKQAYLPIYPPIGGFIRRRRTGRQGYELSDSGFTTKGSNKT
jgi:hypothetical protein